MLDAVRKTLSKIFYLNIYLLYLEYVSGDTIKEIGMKKFVYDKLVRDLTPEQLEENRGANVHYTELQGKHYIQELRRKLVEEVEEIIDAKDRKELLEECGDVCEVIAALCEAHGITADEVIQAQSEKRKRHGAFNKGMYISHIEVAPDTEHAAYFQQRPAKYPELEDIDGSIDVMKD